jgi:diguanylate cyclase (GGDEF)-like protein/PAS domain S-box-containing protein
MRWDFILHLIASLISCVCAWSAARKWHVRGSHSLFTLCLSIVFLNLTLAWQDFLLGPGVVSWVHALILLFSMMTPLLTLLQLREIQHWQRIEQELKESESTFRVLFENSPDAIILTDINTLKILDCNENACRMNGRSREELIGQPANVLHMEDTASLVDDPSFRENMFRYMSSGKTVSMEVNHRYPDGSLRVIETNMSLLTVHGRRALMGIDRDITDRKAAERQVQQANEDLAAQLAENQKLQELLREQALRDALTGLYNRRFLQETLDRELAEASRTQTPLSLLMLDVDFFKELNDTYGHAAGDVVLQTIAGLLQQQFRAMDLPCRYGGEEFVMVMPTANCPAALTRAETLRQLIAGQQTLYHGQSLQVTVSVGVASFPEHGTSGDELLRAADGAMYAAKQAGRNTVVAASSNPR